MIVPERASRVNTMANASHNGTPLILKEFIRGAQSIAIKADNKNGTIITAAAFIPATIIMKLARPSATRNALPLSVKVFMTLSVRR